MNRNIGPLLLSSAALAFTVLFATSCAHDTPVEHQVAAEVQGTAPVAQQKLDATSREILFEAPSLNAQQKERLRHLHDNALRESTNLQAELSKNQVVLMKTLVNPKAKDEEIEVLKDRIVRLEKDRTQHFLATLDKAKRILGRRNSDDERFYRAFLFEPLQPDVMP